MQRASAIRQCWCYKHLPGGNFGPFVWDKSPIGDRIKQSRSRPFLPCVWWTWSTPSTHQNGSRSLSHFPTYQCFTWNFPGKYTIPSHTCVFQTRKYNDFFFPHLPFAKCTINQTSQRGPVNAFSDEFLQAYGRVFDSLTEDGYDVRAVVLSSAFPKIFTAGLDCTWSLFFSPLQSFIWIQLPLLWFINSTWSKWSTSRRWW